jgi:hypothetical protein
MESKNELLYIYYNYFYLDTHEQFSLTVAGKYLKKEKHIICVDNLVILCINPSRLIVSDDDYRESFKL